MKQDTKKLVLIGGAALAALYAYSTMGGEDYAGMGGGGGLPLLPTLPEAAAGAAGAAAPIVVNIPGMEPPIGWDTEGTKKSQAIIDKYESVYAPAQAALDISTRLGAPTAADVAAYGESKKGEDKITSDKPWYAPWTWDTSEAVENYQAWATRSTERTLGISPSTKSTNKATESIRAAMVRGEKSKITSTLTGRYASRSGSERTRSDAFTSMGQRTYSSARSAALSSSKKAQSRPGSPD